MSDYCYICYDFEDELLVCDICDELYCYDCSYSYTYHFTYEGNLCHLCSDQKRKKPLTYSDIRDNKIKLCLDVTK